MLGDPAFPLLWNTNGDRPDERSLPTWCSSTGQREDAALNWGWLDALHPDDRAHIRDAWRQAILTPHTMTLSYQIRSFQQGYRPLKALHVPLFDVERHLQGWLVFFTDQPINPPLADDNWEIKLMNSLIFSQTALGVLCLSLDGSILRANNHFCQLTGYTEAEVGALTLWQLGMPEERPAHLQAIHACLSGEPNIQPFCTRYRRKDGTSIWVKVTQFLIRQPDGEPYYFFFTIENIHAQVQAEAERAELIARFQETHNEVLNRTRQLEAILEAITDGILVSDREGNIIHSNEAIRRLLHLDRSPDFLKQPFAKRLAQLKAIDENGQELTLEQWPLARVLRGETLQANRERDLLVSLPDGQEIYVNHTGACIRDQDNQLIGAVVVIRDVNERHIIEERIQKSFRILLALAESLVNLPESTAQPDTTQQTAKRRPSIHPFQTVGEYLAELTCQMLEYKSVVILLLDPVTETFKMVAIAGVPQEEQAYYYENFSSVRPDDYLKERSVALLRENQVVTDVNSYHLNDNSPYNILIAPMLINERLVGVLSVEKTDPNASYTDEEFSLLKAIAKLILLVIERERIQNEWIEVHSSELALREANRRFDEFLSIASHELRTPLAGIKGNIQLALRRLAALKSDQLPGMDLLFEKLNKVQDYLLQAEHRVNVQNRMLSDLLDVTRIQANKLELVLAPCDLLQVVLNAVKDQQYIMPERIFVFDLPHNQPLTVIGDADRLGQVIHNYLTNALKYSLPDRPITVHVTETGGEAYVSVQDQGPGLTPEEQKRVWERFYRVKGISAQGGGPGLGLGLHICRTIIEAHQGNFGLESIPGEGSTFWFTLPLAPSSLNPSEPCSSTRSEYSP